jgi:AcrR family transcriptional regulator
MPGTITPVARGLRERKKMKTREAIQREATRLFQQNGYEETTIEQIAAAVEISPSTFFNYFPSKEDVLLYDAYDPMIGALFTSRPADEPLSVSVRSVLRLMASTFERDREIILTRSKLILETPDLQARLWAEVERAQAFLGAVLAQRAGRASDDFEFRVVITAVVAAMLEAAREWTRRDGRVSLNEMLDRALDLVDADSVLDRLASRKS